MNINLPISEIIPELFEKLKTHNTLIITAPPGAGKSTLLPLSILENNDINKGKILMLEPRRLATRSIAIRMSEMINKNVGEEIGYRVRFETCVSEKTRLEVLTEGILTRILLSDNELKGVTTIIFDEFHERNLNADLALALCRECQQILRPDLKIIIMSATIDTEKLSNLLNAPVIESKGKMFPVETIYEGSCDEFFIAEQTTKTILKAIKSYQGDLLAFLPGEAEIHKCEEMLKKQNLTQFAIHPLYGMLPQSKQLSAIFPDKNGKRKIVLATSIAETSLTIEGIKIVVDSGFCKIQKFNPNTELSHLETVKISQDMADQRKGRAGRLCSGVCFRLWSNADMMRMEKNRKPEIEYADLAPLVLDLAKWGENNVENLTWLTPPPNHSINKAKEILLELDAIDENGNITSQGLELQKIPCHPRIAKMLIEASKLNILSLGTDIASILDDRDPMNKEVGIDINLRIEALRKNRAENRHNKMFDRIENNALQYRKIFHSQVDNNDFDYYDTGLLLAYAFPERIASAKPGNNAQFMLSNGSIAMADHNDTLANEPWLSIASLNARDGIGKIFLASPLNPSSLKQMIKERDNITWNTKKGGLIARHEMRLGNIILKEKPLNNIDNEIIVNLIIAAIKKEGENLLNFNEEVIQWQNRVSSLKIWNKEQEWPDVSTKTLISNCEQWLSPYLNGIRTSEQLKNLDLLDPLQYNLDIKLQSLLNKLAPKTIEVPTGSKIKIKYRENGEQPILAVRLQEVFGMSETPKINNGKISILMHLLSPGYKPVQITSDLKSFWENTYYEVKKELKTRYPKHIWPENPMNEKPNRK